MAGAANEDWFRDPRCVQEATGYQWRNASHGRAPTLNSVPDPKAVGGFHYDRNGGLMVRRRVEVSDDTTMIRFVAAIRKDGLRRSSAEMLNSPWWLTMDRFMLLLMRAREAGVGLVEMARRQLAIPEDFSACDTIVRARVRRGIVLACYAGPGISAAAGGERRIIASEAKTLWMEQLYIPGLGRMPWLLTPPVNAAGLWLEFERTYDARARGFG